MNKGLASSLTTWSKQIDWKLLVFLLLFLNVKLVVKLLALALIYVFRFNLRFGFRIRNSRLPLFYVVVIAVAIVNWLMYGYFRNLNYNIVFITAVAFWAASILAIHQLKIAVERNETRILHNTILVFFAINVAASLIDYALIVIETGAINPYQYQGNYQEYFIGTGDYIKGITFDNSTTNAIINSFGIVYFLFRKNYLMLLCCMVVFILTGSNFTNVILLLIFAALFIYLRDRSQKSMLVVCFMMLVIFMVKVSPDNNRYIFETFKNISSPKRAAVDPAPSAQSSVTNDSIALTPDQQKEKIAKAYIDSIQGLNTIPVAATASLPVLDLPKVDIHSPPYQRKFDTSTLQQSLIDYISLHKTELPLSSTPFTKETQRGKLLAVKQTFSFLKANPQKLLTGNGSGNFSSKIAFKATAMNITGGYPARYAYINNDFRSNHFDVYLYYFSQEAAQHSLMNSPNSVYMQLLGEYGIVGLLAFLIFYAGYFLTRVKKLTYGIPLLIILIAVFFGEYWFEQLSIVIIFELLMLVDMKNALTNKLGT